MEVYTPGNGKMGIYMVMVEFNTVMEVVMRENGSMGVKPAPEYFDGLMVGGIKVKF